MPGDTARLSFRHADEGDASFMLRLLNEPSWRRFITDHSVDSEEAARAYLQERILPGYRSGLGFCLLESSQDGSPLGICGLIKRDYLEHIDLGFALLEQYWGQGYAAEAARATIDYAFGELALDELWAVTVPANANSIRLLERLGFQYLHNTRDPKDEAVAVYALSRNAAG
ncbi:MAG: GNAT family N-acetyltransferase [Pseudomonadales bacterium]|nr:GNAT family N-acetyltransferase [Pseudomonadales bacterium]